MTITKKEKDQLMVWANDVIGTSAICNNGAIISDSYNGQIAAFSVSVALSGLKPAVALYYSGKGSSDVDKKEIIKLLAAMYNKKHGTQKTADDFFKAVINANEHDLPVLKQEIIEFGIALKFTVRTFKFRGNG